MNIVASLCCRQPAKASVGRRYAASVASAPCALPPPPCRPPPTADAGVVKPVAAGPTAIGAFWAAVADEAGTAGSLVDAGVAGEVAVGAALCRRPAAKAGVQGVALGQ